MAFHKDRKSEYDLFTEHCKQLQDDLKKINSDLKFKVVVYDDKEKQTLVQFWH